MEQEEDGKQICLWAYELGIVHPVTKEDMNFKCLPQKIGSWKIIEDVEVVLNN